MFTLIKREIEDSMAYFIIAIIIAVIDIIVLLFAYNFNSNKPFNLTGLLDFFFIFMTIGLIPVCALGTSQMYYDRTKKISTFLSTLAVSRKKLFTAKILAGLIGVLFFFLPLVITSRMINSRFLVPIPTNIEMFNDIILTLFLGHLAVYSVGLLIGSGNIRFPHLTAIIIAAVIIPLIMIKGFQTQALLMLTFFITISLIRSWQKFSKASF